MCSSFVLVYINIQGTVSRSMCHTLDICVGGDTCYKPLSKVFSEQTEHGVALQITETIIHFWKQAPILAHILLGIALLIKPMSHLKIQDGHH